MNVWSLWGVAGVFFALAGCGQTEEIEATGEEIPTKDFAEDRNACLENNPEKNLYFGDLHIHTKHSFDAWAYDVRVSPSEAYLFAQGETIYLPPLDADGNGTRAVQLERPLDFAAVTDHAELLAETLLCTSPDSEVYSLERCTNFNQGGGSAVDSLALVLASEDPVRWEGICGAENVNCGEVAQDIWTQIKGAANTAYDRTNACSFTAFQAYEYTSARNISNMHRNVIFRGDESLDKPITLFEAPTPEELWKALDESCIQQPGGCDVLAIPHNSNWSNGNMFQPLQDTVEDPEERVSLARLRARMEPLVEMFQHKGDAECRNDFADVLGDDDPLCTFEKMRIDTLQDCGEGVGAAAMIGLGCISRRDYVRYALIDGIVQENLYGVNPWKFGLIGGTDTHNGTPGMVEETEAFPGHVGIDDDEISEQLGFGNLVPGGALANPGGLVAAWAEENTRESLFNALRNREVYATSGTRIALRFFAGWEYDEDLCADADLVKKAYAGGVPMGGDLPPKAGKSPRFIVTALADPGTSAHPGAPLERIQIIKGWTQSDGKPVQSIVDVAGAINPDAGVDLDTCKRSGTGQSSLCAVWEDPDFDPEEGAVYYARVLENPSCRYHSYFCKEFAEEDQPLSCTSDKIARTIQERAWSSPIWFTP